MEQTVLHNQYPVITTEFRLRIERLTYDAQGSYIIHCRWMESNILQTQNKAVVFGKSEPLVQIVCLFHFSCF